MGGPWKRPFNLLLTFTLLLGFPAAAIAQVILPEPNDEATDNINLTGLPQNLLRKSETLSDGKLHTWYEYVPTSYTGEQAVPLVVSLHGAGSTGARQAQSTGWHLVAERDGFIVVFPNSSSNRDVPDPANRWDTRPDGPDVEYLKALIDLLTTRYRINTSRIYMHGTSNGDMMSLAFAIRHGDMLAGLASSIGPTHPAFLDDGRGGMYRPTVALPVFQWRGEQDIIVLTPPRNVTFDADGRDEVNAFNRSLWLDVNGNDPIPEIRIRGKDNLLIFKGGKAPLLYNEVKDAPHQTETYAADVMWTELLSGYARGPNGEIVALGPKSPAKGDEGAVAIALGSGKAFIDNRIVMLAGSGPVLIGDSMYVPITFLSQAFGADVEKIGDGRRAVVRTPDGRTVGLASGNAVVTVDNRVRVLDQKVLWRNGELWIPLRTVSEKLFSKNVSYHSGVAYISDHEAELSRGVAKVLKELLK